MVLNFCSEESCPKVKIQKFWKNQAEQISEISLVSTWAFGRPVNGVLRRCFRQAIKERQAGGHMYKSPWLCSSCYMERASGFTRFTRIAKELTEKDLFEVWVWVLLMTGWLAIVWRSSFQILNFPTVFNTVGGTCFSHVFLYFYLAFIIIQAAPNEI